MSGPTTDEIMRPDFEEDGGRCHWWSALRHCWHEDVCACTGVGPGSCLHRTCCHCGEVQKTQLIVAGHGPYLPDKTNQTLIWNGWRKPPRAYYVGSPW